LSDAEASPTTFSFIFASMFCERSLILFRYLLMIAFHISIQSCSGKLFFQLRMEQCDGFFTYFHYFFFAFII